MGFRKFLYNLLFFSMKFGKKRTKGMLWVKQFTEFFVSSQYTTLLAKLFDASDRKKEGRKKNRMHIFCRYIYETQDSLLGASAKVITAK